MRLKLLTSWNGLKAGEIIEIDDTSTARDLMARGVGEPAQVIKVVIADVQEPPENKMVQAPAKRKRGRPPKNP